MSGKWTHHVVFGALAAASVVWLGAATVFARGGAGVPAAGGARPGVPSVPMAAYLCATSSWKYAGTATSFAGNAGNAGNGVTSTSGRQARVEPPVLNLSKGYAGPAAKGRLARPGALLSTDEFTMSVDGLRMFQRSAIETAQGPLEFFAMWEFSGGGAQAWVFSSLWSGPALLAGKAIPGEIAVEGVVAGRGRLGFLLRQTPTGFDFQTTWTAENGATPTPEEGAIPKSRSNIKTN